MTINENPLVQAIMDDTKWGDRIYHQDSRVMLIKADVKSFIEYLFDLSIYKAKFPVLIVTDPPYEFESRGGGLYKESESMDKIQELGTDKFDFKSYIPLILNKQEVTAGFINAYFFCNMPLLFSYIAYCEKWGYVYDILILDRASAPPAHSSHYVSHLEYCVFIRNGTSRSGRSKIAPFIGKAEEGEGVHEDRWRKIYRMNPGEVKTEHPNEKPLNMIKRLIMNSSKENDLVFDPFIGSGTTAIAARDLNRFCIGVDKSGDALEMATVRLRQLTLGI